MAQQAVSTMASAVIGGITDRALTTVMRKLRSGSRPAAAHEKLQRLETLVLKLRCAVEVSERHAIGSASLLEWRDRLRDAAAEAGAVVLDFQRRAREEDGGEAASTSSSAAPGQQPAGALYFTRSALLSGIAQQVRDATRRLFSTDEDMKKLDAALEKMERLSPDITQFLLTLQLEVSPQLGQRLPVARRIAPASIPPERIQRRRVSMGDDQPAVLRLPSIRYRLHHGKMALLWDSASGCSGDSSHRVTLWDSEQRSRKAMQLECRQNEARALASVLEPTLRSMDGCIKATDDKDMEGLEWLEEWAAVLREAVERGNAVLQTLCPGSELIHKASGALEEDGELYSFVREVQRLDKPPWFAVLMELCPRR